MKSTTLIWTLLLISINNLFAQPYVLKNPDNPVYVDTVVQRIDISMDADSLTTMYNNLDDHEYPADVFINNRTTTDTILQAAISLRGNTSMGSAKKSFKISFNTFTPGRKYHKLEKMNLNGEHNDPSICRSKFYWETLESMNVPGPRSNHYEVYINGNYYGLYANVEHIDENFVKSRFTYDSGNLYKCLYPADLAYLGNDPNLYKFISGGRRTYELQTNTDIDDYSDLARFIQQLNNNVTSSFQDSLELLFNVNSFLRAYAVDIATGNWDNYGINMNNFYLYKNSETGKFEFIPYDTDNTFGVDWFGITWSTRDMYQWEGSGSRPLVTKLMAKQDYVNRFSFFMNQLLHRDGDTSVINSRIYHRRDLLDPYVFNDLYHSYDYGFTYYDFYGSFDFAWGNHVTEGIIPYIANRHNNSVAQLQLNPVPPIFSETRHIPFAPVAGDSIFVRSWIEDDEPFAGVYLKYKWNSGSVDSVEMFDNGSNRDYIAGDEYFGAGVAPGVNGDTLYYYISHTDNGGLTGREPRNGWSYVVVNSLPPIKINEWMAFNTSTITDEALEFEDWIELYNTQNTFPPLHNVYLSDSLENPGKWHMKDTSITSNGFLLLWADEDKSQGPMHMSFKLSSTSGENIYLSYFNGDQYRIIDSVSFGSMVANQSIGCLPDGTTPMVTQTPTSPGASNFTVGINEVENQFSETIYPNPATDHFRITLSSQSKGVAEIQLFDLSGKMISLQSNLHVEMGMNHFSLERPFSIASGMYRLRINMKQNDGSTIESNSKIVFE